MSCLLCSSVFAVTIEIVSVGNLGNLNDPGTGNFLGGVSTPYRIGTTEATVGQYTSFLNAVADTDTYSLYNTAMATDLNIAGITQSGPSGSYTYQVIGSVNRPVTYISWGDAVRFANWLHNGQPTGPQNSSTTEDGAYTLNGATTHAALMAVTRNPGASWFLPTENEWYKAAYHQPAADGGDSDSYWVYPMKNNSHPYSDQPPGTTPGNTRVGNFSRDDGIANGYDDGYAVTGSTSFTSSQNYLTDVGAYMSSPSFYGTFDQGGNVLEWNETVVFGRGNSTRGVRGGTWNANVNGLNSSSRSSRDSTFEDSTIGFRVASAIPEPSTSLLLSMAAICLQVGCRRRMSRLLRGSPNGHL